MRGVAFLTFESVPLYHTEHKIVSQGKEMSRTMLQSLGIIYIQFRLFRIGLNTFGELFFLATYRQIKQYMDISSGMHENENSCNFSNFNPFIIIFFIRFEVKNMKQRYAKSAKYRSTNTNISQQP